MEAEAPPPNEQEVKKALPESPAQAEVRGNSDLFKCVIFFFFFF